VLWLIIVSPAVYCLLGCKSELIDISSGKLQTRYEILSIPFYWTNADSAISRVLGGTRPVNVEAKWRYGHYWERPWLRHYSPLTTWGPAVAQVGRLDRQWVAYCVNSDAQKKMASDVLCLWQCGSDPALAEEYLDWVDSTASHVADGMRLTAIILRADVCKVRTVAEHIECDVRIPPDASARTFVVHDDRER